MRADMPKVRDEVCRFAQIYFAEPRLTAVLVHMNMEHTYFVIHCKVQRLSDSARPHHRANTWITEVIVVCNRMEIVRQDDPTVGS